MVYDVSFVASGPCVRACVHACVSECASEKLFVTGITGNYTKMKLSLVSFTQRKEKKKMKNSTGARADGNGIYIYIFADERM